MKNRRSSGVSPSSKSKGKSATSKFFRDASASKQNQPGDRVKCVMCGEMVLKSESNKRGHTIYTIFCLPCNAKVNEHERNNKQASQEAKERRAKRTLARKMNPIPVKKGKKGKKKDERQGDGSKSVFTVWSGQTPKDYGK